MKFLRYFFFLLFLLGTLRMGDALAEEINLRESREPSGSFTLYWENDVFARTDRDYTNGLKLTWSTAMRSGGAEDGHMPGWSYPVFNLLPLIGDPDDRRSFSLSLGQSIYTPENTQRTDLIRNDRPYAGYLYLGFGFNANSGRRMTIWELDLGVVGPASQGEELQNLTHHIIGSEPARGWNNQLPNTAAVELICETKWRLWQWQAESGWGVGAISHVGGHAGNVAIYANAGAEIRFGLRLPEDFGSCPIRPGCDINGVADLNAIGGSARLPFGIHLFVGVNGRYVLHDIFIDGTGGGPDLSISRKPLVADVMTGIAVQYKRVRATYAYVLRTKQFEEQNEDQLFGAFTIALIY